MSTVLKDLVNVQLGKVSAMDEAEKKQLLDSVNETVDGKKRGLIITFDLSSSVRLTNNRLYTPKGQRDYVHTWTQPYPKPILINHDRNSEPIGRIIEVNWVDNDAECMPFFDNIRDFMSFKREVDSDDPQRIYKAMSKHSLLTNDKWPGLGRLVAKAKISSPDAIEKFLDGRYLTFSAGSQTNRYACGACGSNWAQGDICEHHPGTISDEGELGVFITGSFEGNEASVVNMPGNSLMQVRAMEFGDSADTSAVPEDAFKVNRSEIRIIDAEIDTGDFMPTTDDLTQVIEGLKLMDARDIARAIWDNTFSEEQQDALKARTHYETTWLVRVHDALHQEHDWRLRYEEDTLQIPEAVFKLHGDLHMLSSEKGFRDSLLNGALDGFDAAGAPSEEYMMKKRTKDEAGEPTFEEQFKLALDSEHFTAAVKAALEVQNGVQEDEEEEGQEEVNNDGTEEAKPLDLNWFVLGAATSALLAPEAALDSEALEALEDSQFIGPERAIAIPNADYAQAAREAADRIGLEDEVKDQLLALIDEKAQAFATDTNCTDEDLQVKLDKLTNDYKESVALASSLQDQVNELSAKLAELDKSNVSADTDGNGETPKVKVEDIQSVEDPSESNARDLNDEDNTLDPYKKGVVKRFKELRDNVGQQAADQYLFNKYRRGHLPKSFDITPYLQETE